MHTRFWWGILGEKDHLEDPDVDGRIILRWIFRKLEGVVGLDSVGLEQGQMAGPCEYVLKFRVP